MPVLFGNPGSTELPITDALGRQDAASATCSRSTSRSAMGMADGYAQVTGRPAAVNVHVQPGLANAMSGILNAARCRVPLVVTVGQQVQESAARGALPRRRAGASWPRPLAKGAWEVARADGPARGVRAGRAHGDRAPARAGGAEPAARRAGGARPRRPTCPRPPAAAAAAARAAPSTARRPSSAPPARRWSWPATRWRTPARPPPSPRAGRAPRRADPRRADGRHRSRCPPTTRCGAARCRRSRPQIAPLLARHDVVLAVGHAGVPPLRDRAPGRRCRRRRAPGPPRGRSPRGRQGPRAGRRASWATSAAGLRGPAWRASARRRRAVAARRAARRGGDGRAARRAARAAARARRRGAGA